MNSGILSGSIKLVWIVFQKNHEIAYGCGQMVNPVPGISMHPFRMIRAPINISNPQKSISKILFNVLEIP